MQTNYTLSASGATDPGLRRTNNEDTFVVDPDCGFFLVADGMGGAAAGEVASQHFKESATRRIFSGQERSEAEASSLVKQTFLEANSAIIEHARQHPDHSGLGCTAELILFHNKGFVLGHIGDSRTYRLKNGQLKRLTKDHSLVQDQLDQGIINEEDARTHRLRNVIHKAVGIEEQLEIDLVRGRCFAGDIFLLCSDGLSDMVGDRLLEAAIKEPDPLQQRVQHLITLAKEGGGRDNITAVLIEVGP